MYSAITDISGLIGASALVSLTDDAGIGEVDSVIAAKAITDADATIDAYCQKYYTIPLSPVPPKIAELSVDIAVYNLYSRSDLAMPEIRKERKDAAIRFLEKVAAGTIPLGATTPAPTNTSDVVSTNSAARIFTRESMKGF